MSKEWEVGFCFEDGDYADSGLLSDITSYKHMWISSIGTVGESICITVESASYYAEYDIKRLAEQYSHYVISRPTEVMY